LARHNNIFRDPFYAGTLHDPWNGEDHLEQHLPMVNRETFDKVQQIIARRGHPVPHRTVRPEFPLRTLQSGSDAAGLRNRDGQRFGAGALGQQEFTRLIHYAYDHGIRFFDAAEAYQIPGMLGEALKGLPRDSYCLMNKVTTFHEGIVPHAKFDELRRISQTEYFDIMLLHWQHTPDWPETTKRWQDGILEAQQRKIITYMVLPCMDCRRCVKCLETPGSTWD
jgi:hypothetical protein